MPVCRGYVLAQSGPGGPYHNMLALIDPSDFDPATNEMPLGIGDTGTSGIEGIALSPVDGEIYGVDYNYLGTFQADGTFVRYTDPVGVINGSYGSYEVIDVDGLSFEPETGIFWASVRRESKPDLIIQLDTATGKAIPGAFGGDDYLVVPPLPSGANDIDALAIRPVDGVLFAVLNKSGQEDVIAAIDKATGMPTNLGPLFYPLKNEIIEDIEGLDFDCEGNLWAVTGNKNYNNPQLDDQLWDVVWNVALNRFETSSPRPLSHGTDYESVTFGVWRHEAITLFSRWHLPAGATAISGTIFDSYILIANPTMLTAPVSLTFISKNGPVAFTTRTLEPQSRMTVKINDYVAPAHAAAGAVSTVVRSLDNVPILCERAVYWPGESGPAGWVDGHDTIGIGDPAEEWNLSEGATHIFDQFIHVLNPGPEPAQVVAVFMNQAGFTWQTESGVGAESNWTIHVNQVVGENEGQVSTQVKSQGGAVAVDRTMYWPKGGPVVWIGGHCSRGISQAATTWQLAEGANHLFDHYVLVSNPSGAETAKAKFTFMDKDGNTATHEQDVGPLSRYTVKVNNIAGWGTKDQVSTTVESLNGVSVFAERAMYWPKGGPWIGGHNSIGASAPAQKWYLPEGANHLFDHYVLVSNPSDTETLTAKFTFMDNSGDTAVHQKEVGPQRRYTVKVNDIPGWESKSQVSTVVESLTGSPIFAERAMYWPKGGAASWIGGHDTVGIAEMPPYSFTQQFNPAGGESENVLIYNPSSDSVARVRISTDGGVTDQELEIEPLTSQIIRVKERAETLSQVSEAQASDTPVVVESNIPVVVEGAEYRSTDGPAE